MNIFVIRLTGVNKKIEQLEIIETDIHNTTGIMKKISKDSLRINSLDTLRGYCVILMIAWHYYFFLKSNYPETNFFIFWIMNVIGLVGNPIFIIVMGTALILSLDSRKKNGKSYRDNILHLIKRFFIFLVANQILVFSYFLYFGISVFQMPELYPGWIPALGINAIICFLLMNLRKLFRVFIMLGIEIEIMFGLIPYIGIDFGSLFYMIFGTIIGDLIIEARKNNKMWAFQKKIFLSGLILFILGIPSEIYVSHEFDLTVPNNTVLHSPFFIIYALGFFLLMFSVLFYIQDYNKKLVRLLRPLTIFSSLSLTLYYIHYIIGTNFFMPFGFGNRFSVYSYGQFLLCFYIATYLIGLLWSRSRYKYSIEWIIQKFS